MILPRRALRHGSIFIVILIIILYFSARQNGQPRPLSIVKSSFDWSTVTPTYPVSSLKELPSGRPHDLRRIQFKFGQGNYLDARKQKSRRRVIRQTFVRGWESYKKHAWMKDELQPLSAGGRNTLGGWAATLIDSLDTLWIMGLKDDFRDAVDAVATIDWGHTNDTACNMFEVNIRHLGGLLAAYDMSGEHILLDKAVELGDMLYAGFDTPNRMPPIWLNFQKAKSGNLTADTHGASAAAGSFALEFTRLSQLTGDHKYYDAISRVTDLLEQTQDSTKLPGMWPTYLNLRNQNLTYESTFTLGALADSLYEYLPKMYALLGGLDPRYENLYRKAADTIEKNLLFRPMLPDEADVLFSGSVIVNNGTKFIPEGQHLSCFVGGMFALGGRLFDIPEHINLGIRLTKGCVYAYNAFPTGIMPELFRMIPCETLEGCDWDEDIWKKQGNNRFPKGFPIVRNRSYLLRPEAIESIFLLYRMTGITELKEVAWQIFESIQRATIVELGNAAIADVTVTGVTKKKDSMESFWLGETLKYFYLIFSPPDFISLDDFVFNTEAHPLKRQKLSLKSGGPQYSKIGGAYRKIPPVRGD